MKRCERNFLRKARTIKGYLDTSGLNLLVYPSNREEGDGLSEKRRNSHKSPNEMSGFHPLRTFNAAC
jgi:hypothetical protein